MAHLSPFNAERGSYPLTFLGQKSDHKPPKKYKYIKGGCYLHSVIYLMVKSPTKLIRNPLHEQHCALSPQETSSPCRPSDLLQGPLSHPSAVPALGQSATLSAAGAALHPRPAHPPLCVGDDSWFIPAGTNLHCGLSFFFFLFLDTLPNFFHHISSFFWFIKSCFCLVHIACYFKGASKDWGPQANWFDCNCMCLTLLKQPHYVGSINEIIMFVCL